MRGYPDTVSYEARKAHHTEVVKKMQVITEKLCMGIDLNFYLLRDRLLSLLIPTPDTTSISLCRTVTTAFFVRGRPIQSATRVGQDTGIITESQNE